MGIGIYSRSNSNNTVFNVAVSQETSMRDDGIDYLVRKKLKNICQQLSMV